MNTPVKVEQPRFRPVVDDPSPFQDSERVVYEKTPLDLVICQLRFPPILKISSEAPARFQDKLRSDYPLYREPAPLALGVGLPRDISSIIEGMLPLPSVKAHEFLSEDEQWVVTLTHESLALTCKNYSRWEDFRSHLQSALDLLVEIYRPPFFTRVGLRYRDLIRRSLLGLREVPWVELLSRDLAGELHSRIGPHIEGLGRQIVVGLQDGRAKVTIQHGFAKKDGEICYIIDSDFYATDRTESQDAMAILNYFNRQSGRLFRWTISQRLHDAMEPRAV
jgi:uncharacterized protein (TIGR04255 family)